VEALLEAVPAVDTAAEALVLAVLDVLTAALLDATAVEL